MPLTEPPSLPRKAVPNPLRGIAEDAALDALSR